MAATTEAPTVPVGVFDEIRELVPAADPRAGIVSISPDRMDGVPCFAGTRVPAQLLWDSLEVGDSVEDFLYNYPTVLESQLIEAIHTAAAKFLEGLPTR